MVSPEHGHILKLKRALKHLEDFEVEFQGWTKTHPYRTTLEPDPDRPGETVLKSSAQQSPLDPFSLIIGDIVQNLRSSLDHLLGKSP